MRYPWHPRGQVSISKPDFPFFCPCPNGQKNGRSVENTAAELSVLVETSTIPRSVHFGTRCHTCTFRGKNVKKHGCSSRSPRPSRNTHVDIMTSPSRNTHVDMTIRTTSPSRKKSARPRSSVLGRRDPRATAVLYFLRAVSYVGAGISPSRSALQTMSNIPYK